jgi:MAF protein
MAAAGEVATDVRLVLASASPRRLLLLGLLELAWRASPADVDEPAYLLDEPLVAALNVALAKSRATFASADEIVVAADTLVVADGRVLGKPADAEEAWLMLQRLGGRTHQVLTGVALRASQQLEWGGVVATRVVMRDYAEAEIKEYIERGEPFDKAGGYAIQDARFQPVDRVEGCYLNVVGLPLCAVAAGLRALGIETRAAGSPPCEYCRAGARLV